MNEKLALGLGGAVAVGLLALLVVYGSPESPSESGSGSGGLAVVPGMPGAPGLGAAPVAVLPTGNETPAAEPSVAPEQAPPATTYRIEPPEDPQERQAWHLETSIPAWTDLAEGLRISQREGLAGPVSDLLLRLEQARGGVSREQYVELLAQQHQLLGTLAANYPRLFPIIEPMERLEAMLEQLNLEP